jgi:hypothetical protein
MNKMNDFTLSMALGYLKKNLLITSILFVAVFYLLSNFSILDDKYEMTKTIKVGTYPSELGFTLDLLDKDAIELILGSQEFLNILINSHGIESTVKYKVNVHLGDKKNLIGVNFRGDDNENIIKVSDALIFELKKIDAPIINAKIELIKKQISIINSRIEFFNLFNNSQVLSDEDIRQYAEYQRIFDDVYNQNTIINSGVSSPNTGVSTLSLSRLKTEQSMVEINNKQLISTLKTELYQLDSALKDFKEISYLLPEETGYASIFFPTRLTFIGLSLLLAVFYNLIMLNYYIQKHNK